MAEVLEIPLVLKLLNEAYREAISGKLDAAVSLFCAARSELISYVDSSRLAAAIASEDSKLAKESREFEEAAADRHRDGDMRTVLLSDSLGLPRPGPGEADDFEKTYAGIIHRSELGGVQPLFKRTATTVDVMEALESRARASGANIMIHIGLNDCAVRMFSKNERIALSLVSEYLRNRFVQFAKVHRTSIVLSNLDYTYTSLEDFRCNIEKIIKTSSDGGARKIFLATIVKPPEKFEIRTPRMAWNFGRYNAIIKDVAAKFECALVDLDYILERHGKEQALSPDGMHLSAVGHRIVADAYLSAQSV